MAKIISIDAIGVAKKLGIKKGEELLSFDGNPFIDILDYTFFDSKDIFDIQVKDKLGIIRDIHIKKDEFETLGLNFGEEIEITPKNCVNKCMFCFVDQLQKGLRETLYVKDDDYRTSFTCGSFITLTNLTQKDYARILDYKLSPLYISVHCTEETIRLKMLGIKRSKPIMEALKLLVSNGIKLHTQIVLVPEVNDGDKLLQSLIDLKSMGENILSVAVVPVGLTTHREGLLPLKCVDKSDANRVIDIVEKFNNNQCFCFAADEFYQIANRELPNYESYGEFDQIENGVGLITKFLQEIKDNLSNLPKKLNKKIGIITGVAGYPTMIKAKELLENRASKLKISVYKIQNTFFGQTVTVTGLVTAGDIIKELKDKNLEDELYIPNVMLREFENVFLDGISLEELSQTLGKKVIVSAVDGECFIDSVVYGE